MRRSKSASSCSAGLAIVVALAAHASAAVVWDEATNGDLSNAQAAPTALTLALGTSSVKGTLQGGPDTQDWLAVTVPAGDRLSALVLAVYSSIDQQGFMGVQSGSSFPGDVNTPASYLGYAHFGKGATNGSLPRANLVGTDLLPLMGDNVNVSAGSAGFTPPLPGGTYTFLFQQLGGSLTTYQFDYTLVAVPEPSSSILLGLGVAALASVAGRRTSRRR